MYTDKIQNTYQILRQFRDDGKYDIEDLVDYNSYYTHEDNLLGEYSKNKKLIFRLQYEINVIFDISIVINYLKINALGIYLSILVKELDDYGMTGGSLYQTLSNDDRIKLYIAIIEKNLHKVKSFLLTIDPRIDDNQAYVLAVEIGDQEIIKAIKDQIIKDNWYEKQVYLSNIGDAGTDIANYNKK